MDIQEATLHPATPILTSIAYVIYSLWQNRRLRAQTPVKRELLSWLTLLMVLHNVVLCVFSLVTFIKTFPIVFFAYVKNDFLDFVNDKGLTMKPRLLPWFWVFYVSKIYEILDSIILHLNQRPTSFLQMYHHAGAIICCWALCEADTHLPWIFVVLNSFIHTIMYFYYTLTTLRFRPSFKRIITRMQITQFVSGSALLIIHAIFNNQWSKDKKMLIFQISTLVGNLLYVAVLFILFRAFEKKTYAKTKQE